MESDINKIIAKFWWVSAIIEISAPYQVWSNPDQMGVVCLIVEMIFNIILLSFITFGTFFLCLFTFRHGSPPPENPQLIN